MARYRTALMLFRRDLRLQDNTALQAALAESERVLLAFVFDPRQTERHPYQSRAGLQFMLQALRDLQAQARAVGACLYCFEGLPEQVVGRLRQDLAIEAVFVNRDYTPFSLVRDTALRQCCQTLNIDFHCYGDALLTEPEQVLKADGNPYQVFTPFYGRAAQFSVATPQVLTSGRWFAEPLATADAATLDRFELPHSNALPGGRQVALQRLAMLSQFDRYAEQRDIPSLAATTELSAALKFGCVSVRELYHGIVAAGGPSHPLLRQLYWRDFFTHIAFHFPYVFGRAFQTRYDAIRWPNRRDYFDAWAAGCTGFPLVDAGMRELNQTGWMHNRVRMVVASFLVKDLHVSWRWGERYFAQHLIDYDPCVNNGNWQWAASTGCDAQPYFRIFNPWLQQQKFDPDCSYIKRWLPELAALPARAIHNWQRTQSAVGYPAPIVDHQCQVQHSKMLFQALHVA